MMPQGSNYPHLAAKCLNQPLLLEPAYARVFFSALADRFGASRVVDGISGETLLPAAMKDAISFSLPEEGERRPNRKPYRVEQRIAVLPVEGTLVHKFGYLQPVSGMTGYDGIVRRVEMAIADPDVDGVMLDIDSPGGQVSGVYDAADLLLRYGKEKPIWALANEMACSAAQLLASACSRRLVTQTAIMGSVGVIVAHRSYEKALELAGVDITLIYAGAHKADGNPYQALPSDVKASLQMMIDENRMTFATFVSKNTKMSLEAVLATEAEVYEGKQAVKIGFADQVVNYADAVSTMAEAIKKSKGVNFMNALSPNAEQTTVETMAEVVQPVPIATVDVAGIKVEAATAERARIMGILRAPESKGREAQSIALANVPSMTVEQAQEVMETSPLSATVRTETSLDALMAKESPVALTTGAVSGDNVKISGLSAAVHAVATNTIPD